MFQMVKGNFIFTVNN